MIPDEAKEEIGLIFAKLIMIAFLAGLCVGLTIGAAIVWVAL